MKSRVAVIACMGFLAGCAEEGPFNRPGGGYGASLTMAGGSGVRGVYPDAALYAREFAATNDYAATMIADMRTTPFDIGAPPAGTNSIVGAGFSTDAVVNPHAPVVELIVPDYVNPYAPTIELIVPSGFAAEATATTNIEPVVTPTLEEPPQPGTLPQLPQEPMPQQAVPPAPPETEGEPTPSPKGPGKPL